jgi:peptidoglycan/xylan/chitin deacetylase (PgdA/CDA1 family)
MLGRKELTKMVATGLIEVGAHTHSHTSLARLSPSEQRCEIEHSLSVIHELVGKPCELFAYPNGAPQDYDRESIGILRSLGVRAAVTTIEGVNDSFTPPMELKRYGMGSDATEHDFERMMRDCHQLATGQHQRR